MIGSLSTSNIRKTRNPRQRAISTAIIYRMQGDLKQLLNNLRGKLSIAQYQAMYAKLIRLNVKETQLLHSYFEAGKTKNVIGYLKKKCASIHMKG